MNAGWRFAIRSMLYQNFSLQLIEIKKKTQSLETFLIPPLEKWQMTARYPDPAQSQMGVINGESQARVCPPLQSTQGKRWCKMGNQWIINCHFSGLSHLLFNDLTPLISITHFRVFSHVQEWIVFQSMQDVQTSLILVCYLFLVLIFGFVFFFFSLPLFCKWW